MPMGSLLMCGVGSSETWPPLCAVGSPIFHAAQAWLASCRTREKRKTRYQERRSKSVLSDTGRNPAYALRLKRRESNAKSAIAPAMTNFLPAISTAIKPLNSPALAATPPATSAARPYPATLSTEGLKSA